MLPWNAHPPTSVLLALPYANLDYVNAHFAWNLTMFPCLLGSLLLVMGILPRLATHLKTSEGMAVRYRLSWWMVLPVVVGALLCGPLWAQFMQGQLNLILLLFITAAWALDVAERPSWAGLLLGLAAAIKLFPAFLFFYFLVRRRWWALLAGAFTFLTLTGITLLTFRWDTYRDYIQIVLPSVAEYRSSWFNCSLPGFWTKLFNPHEREGVTPLLRSPALAVTGTLLSATIVLGLTGRVIWLARTPLERTSGFALCLIAMLLLSPITWEHYFLFLLLPLAWLWIYLPHSWPARGAFWLVILLIWLPQTVYYALLLDLPLELLGHQYRETHPATLTQVLLVLSLHCYVLCFLFGLGWWQAQRTRKQQLTQPSPEYEIDKQHSLAGA